MRLHFQKVTEADLACGPIAESVWEQTPDPGRPRFVRVVGYENSDDVVIAFSWDELFLVFYVEAVPRSEVIQKLANFAHDLTRAEFRETRKRTADVRNLEIKEAA